MTLKDIIRKLHNLPLWINHEDDCEYYESKSEIPASVLRYTVKYITVDGDGILTVEI